MDWHGYKAWLVAQLIAFHREDAEDGSLRFTRKDLGDSYLLEVHRQGDAGPPVTMEVTFTGGPD